MAVPCEQVKHARREPKNRSSQCVRVSVEVAGDKLINDEAFRLWHQLDERREVGVGDLAPLQDLDRLANVL